MTSVSTGRAAEQAAAEYLVRTGYALLGQNWRRRTCEIDLIVKKSDTIYFIEVKYRVQARQGSGLEYITPTKLKQMTYAAQLWSHKHDWQGDYTLGAIEVSGTNFEITEFIDSLT